MLEVDVLVEGDVDSGGEVCPYSRLMPGFTVLRHCLLQKLETMGLKDELYYATCPVTGYAEHFRECPDYIKAQKEKLNPDNIPRNT